MNSGERGQHSGRHGTGAWLLACAQSECRTEPAIRDRTTACGGPVFMGVAAMLSKTYDPALGERAST
jgi:hypothetical protein